MIESAEIKELGKFLSSSYWAVSFLPLLCALCGDFDELIDKRNIYKKRKKEYIEGDILH